MSQYFDTFHLILYAVAAAVMLLNTFGRGLLASVVAWFRTGAAKATADADPKLDDDALDLQAFRRLQARFVRLNCKEGQAAMETAGTHFLHGVGGP